MASPSAAVVNNNNNSVSNGRSRRNSSTKSTPLNESTASLRRPSANSSRVNSGSAKLARTTSIGSESATTFSNNNNGATELMIACQDDDIELVNAVIHRNGSSVVLARDNYGRTALHYAAEVAALKCCEVLLYHSQHLLQVQDVDGCTALHGAVIAGNLISVRWLIQHGASPDATDNEEHTVLHWATVSAHPEIVEYLLREIKATPLPDLHHAYPLHYAAQMCGTDNVNSNNGNSNSNVNGQPPTNGGVSGSQGLTSQLALLTLLKLVECGHPLDVCDEDKRQPIIWAANNGAAEACYVLVNAGASVNAADKDGLTALHCAATRGQTRCVAALLRECGAKHDALDSNECTPLFYAATFGHTACCRVLIEGGANANHVDRKRRTASHCAASKGFVDCLKFLISAGANIWQRSVKGDYPMSEAIANGHTGVVTLLLSSFNSEQRKALARVRWGRTPLHSAAAANQLELCKVLLDFGSSINALHLASDQYYSPYDFAVLRGNVEVADYIRARGAAPASKVVRNATFVVQKYFRAWHARQQQQKEAEQQKEQQQERPKSSTNSEHKVEPIVLVPEPAPEPSVKPGDDNSEELVIPITQEPSEPEPTNSSKSEVKPPEQITVAPETASSVAVAPTSNDSVAEQQQDKEPPEQQQEQVAERPKSSQQVNTSQVEATSEQPVVVVPEPVDSSSCSKEEEHQQPEQPAVATAIVSPKKSRPAHAQRNSKKSEAMAAQQGDKAQFDSAASFFDEDAASTATDRSSAANSRQSSGKMHSVRSAAQSLSKPSVAKSQEASDAQEQLKTFDASNSTSMILNEAIFATTATSSEENVSKPISSRHSPLPVASAPAELASGVVTDSMSTYDGEEGVVRVEITATRSTARATSPSASGGHASGVATGSPTTDAPSEDTAATPKRLGRQDSELSSLAAGKTASSRSRTPSATALKSALHRSGGNRAVSSAGQRETIDSSDDLEKLAQQSVSGADTFSIRDEDDDGVESDDGTAELAAARRRRAASRDSGTTNSGSTREMPLSEQGEGGASAQPLGQPSSGTATGPYSRAQSSTKSVRIVETPIVLEAARADVDYDEQELERQRREEQMELERPQQRLWVDALGRAHPAPTTLTMARPLQRLRMKSSVVRVKSVSEQVHKNVSQYERQRLLIDELKRLKRLQILKMNGVDPQYLSRSFTALARKNTIISSTGGIDDAEKLLYDELYRRRLTQYRYMPVYRVEPSNEFAIYQVHNHRSPPITTSTAAWHVPSNNGSQFDIRAASAPLYDPAACRHFEAATKRINQEMMQRVEKAYIPQPHIQLLLDREDQMLSARSGTASPNHHHSQTAGIGAGGPGSNVSISPRIAMLSTSPYGDGIRPHTSPSNSKVPQQQQVMATSTTIMSRGGVVKIRNNATSHSSSPRNGDDVYPRASPFSSRRPSVPPATQKTKPQQQPQVHRAGSAHSPHMQPLLASLADQKSSSKQGDQAASRTSGSNVNLPEV